jgi:GTPase SAR1 family protein
MIILEGPDGGGKTTLAHRLVEELNLEYRRPPENLLSSITGPAEGLVDWWREQLRAPLKQRMQGVYDRCFWISEPIYSSMSGREPMCSTDHLWRGIMDLWAEGPMMVFCMTDVEGMIENVYAGGRPRLANLVQDEYTKLKAINFLYWACYGTWLQSLNHVTHWDYNAHDFSRLITFYKSYRRTVV